MEKAENSRILEAISAVLEAEFGCRAYWKKEKQESDMPCFVITCVNPTLRQFFGKRYFSRNPFCIRYYPVSEDWLQECNMTAEKMNWCLESLNVDGDSFRGTKISWEISEQSLNFYVNYDCFLYKPVESAAMEVIQSQTKVKEGN